MHRLDMQIYPCIYSAIRFSAQLIRCIGLHGAMQCRVCLCLFKQYIMHNLMPYVYKSWTTTMKFKLRLEELLSACYRCVVASIQEGVYARLKTTEIIQALWYK